jgi:hypothetical protein
MRPFGRTVVAMNKLIPFLLLTIGTAANAGGLENSCMMKECSPGDKAVTYATQSDMYWACPTKELAEYTSLLISLVSAGYELTGKLPNISPETGEPEYQGETAVLIAHARHDAHVATFDQATTICHKGRSGILVSIMNNPGKGAAIWVQNDKTKDNFWMPAGMLDKR